MKKFLSIVISILMISAMMSVVALADAATISLSPITGLVAGESVELDVTAADGTTYTVSVNNQVFGLVGGAVSGSITSVDVTAPAKATLTVNSSIPASFTSQIKLQESGKDAIKVDVTVADRLVGDADGSGAVDAIDASQILRAGVGLSTAANYKAIAGNVNGDSNTDAIDASQILRKGVSLSVTNANLGVAYIGGNVSMDIVDPFASSAPVTTPLDQPADPYAYYNAGKVYYEFGAVANASSYTITVGSETFTGITATSGSVTLANAWDGTGTLAVTVTAIGDGSTYSDSTAASTNAVYSNVSGALSAWLSANSISDVAVTVYELGAE
jgi:hypothetical protein